MATVTYAGFSQVNTTDFISGVYQSLGGFVSNSMSVAEVDSIDGVLDSNDMNLAINGSGNYAYTGYTIDGYPVLRTGSSYFVFNNNDITTTSGTATQTSSLVFCFLAGTHIATPHGEVAVEDLQVGDQVLTHDGKTAKVRFNFIQQQRNHIFANKEDLFPICITANALADNVPSRDLYVTPGHAIYFPDWKIFVEAAALINGSSIYQMREMPETFTYHHILCDNQEIVLAENTPAETFIDNATMETFDNYAEYAAMYPQEHDMEELDIPRGVAASQLPRAFNQNLLDRAQMLYPLAQAA